MPTTVLIVDDHPSFRATARMLLESDGLDVVGEAPDGAGAMLAYARLKPDLVLLDVNLPDTDGFTIAQRLTENGDGPKIVLCSSRAAEDFGDLIATSGACGFVPKADLSAAAVLELCA